MHSRLLILLWALMFDGMAIAQAMPTYPNPFDAPEIRLVNVNGNVKKLSDYHGNVILINFWATWCAPCLIEMPELNHLAQRYQSRGFRVITVNVANEPKVRLTNFINRNNLHHMHHYSAGATAVNNWGVTTLPTSFLIDRHGQVIGGIHGILPWLGPAVAQQIEDIL